MIAPGARIRIEVELSAHRGTASFFPVGLPPRKTPLAFGRLQLKEEMWQLRRDLVKVKNRLGPDVGVQDYEALSEALDLLQRRGSRLAQRLFHPHLSDVQEIFCSSIPFWHRDPLPGPPPLVEVEGEHRELLPFEFMPLFDLQKVKPFRTLPELLAVSRRFLGFTTYVRRHIRRTRLVQNRILARSDRLPVKLFHHAGLRGARLETEYFRSRSDLVELRGPWPIKGLARKDFADHLAEQLLDPCLCFDRVSRQSPDQIQHFACHCFPGRESSEEDFLELAHHGNSPRQVRVMDLEDSMVNRQAQATSQRQVLPLVFVNACGSSANDLAEVASFYHFFVHLNGNRGFIGTESLVPDEVAATFSRYFYDRFLDSSSLYEALHHSRWDLLTRHRNPLGLLYTAYADPDLQVGTSQQSSGGTRRPGARGRKFRHTGT